MVSGGPKAKRAGPRSGASSESVTAAAPWVLSPRARGCERGSALKPQPPETAAALVDLTSLPWPCPARSNCVPILRISYFMLSS